MSMSKVWFVTGAGSGIGAATARAALKAGDRVVATGRNLDKVRHALRDFARNARVPVPRQVGKDHLGSRLARPADFKKIDGASASGTGTGARNFGAKK